jgi:hypothetical protein
LANTRFDEEARTRHIRDAPGIIFGS